MSKSCPKCNQPANCVDTRNRGDTTNRRYHCKCGCKFSSCEVIVTVDSELASLSLSTKSNTTQSQLRAMFLKELLERELATVSIRKTK